MSLLMIRKRYPAMFAAGFAALPRAFGLVALVLLAAGCNDSIRQRVPSGFALPAAPAGISAAELRLEGVNVTVPVALTVSMDPQARVPKEDIVWWGEPGTAPVDRRDQVGRIIGEAVTQGLADLGGPRGVRAEVEVLRFHALTPRARASCSIIGCLGNTNIDFTVTLVETATGTVLASSGVIEADPETVQGDEARAADARGETDRGRIIEHVAGVVRSWAASLR